MSSILALISDKARCFSQSERALYANYIINIYVKGELALRRCWFFLHSRNSAIAMTTN